MELLEIMRTRRSVRNYTGEPVSDEKITKILQAGLLAPSGKARRPWEFIVVKDKEVLKQMVGSRIGGSAPMGVCDAAIVVLGNENETDVWIEDCSVAMTQMWLMAEAEGVGACWVQSRLRPATDGRTADEYLRDILGYPENCHALCTLCLGMTAVQPAAYELDSLLTDKIHYGKY
ncbi:MAG: nitroreductase family protein [Dorea sp.]|nr:nitroreductase family protein [Dorea sp.]